MPKKTSASTRPPPNQAVDRDGARKTIPESVARHVWVAAGGRCTICGRYLLIDEHTGRNVPIGQLAHIVGWSTAPGSPRGNDDLPRPARHLAENLMLVCYDQHRVIDHRDMWREFDVDTLRTMKRRHEQRIYQLTGLRDEQRSTVLRVVGNLHGRGVEMNAHGVARALLERDRFPDWTLRGADEYEIDLRALPGEEAGTRDYWIAVRAHLGESLAHLRTQIRKERVSHVSVFALARIPVLVLLGTMLDETLPIDIYPKRRDADEGWGWADTTSIVDFTIRTVRRGTDPTKVAAMFSVSGSVDAERLPIAFDDRYTIYELRPNAELPTPELIRSTRTLDRFAVTWRTLLSTVEQDHPGAPSIPVFPAVPAAAAVTIGRHVMRAAHPPLEIYDRVLHSGNYEFTITTA